jgi:hypothetical protein
MNWPEADTGIEASSGKVHHLVVRGDFQFDLRISVAERDDHCLQVQRDDRSANGEVQEPDGTLPYVAARLRLP